MCACGHSLAAATLSAAGGSSRLTPAEQHDKRQRLLQAKLKMKQATTMQEAATAAVHSQQVLVEEALYNLKEKRELVDAAWHDVNNKRARLDVVQCELELAKSDLKDAKNAYETTKAQEERQ